MASQSSQIVNTKWKSPMTNPAELVLHIQYQQNNLTVEASLSFNERSLPDPNATL